MSNDEITMRDKFAMAVSGEVLKEVYRIARDDETMDTQERMEWVAVWSYELADEMILERAIIRDPITRCDLAEKAQINADRIKRGVIGTT